MKSNTKNNAKSKTITYKNLLQIIDRDGVQYVEMNLNDMLPFIKYVNDMKYKKHLYIKIVNGKCRFSLKPLSRTKINIENEIKHQNLINE